MVRLEQIQLLEKKINKAVEIINLLRQENKALKSTIQKSQDRMAELESLLEQFKGEQNKIEEGILSALNKLDQLEDQVAEASPGETGHFDDSLPSREEASVPAETAAEAQTETEEEAAVPGIDEEPENGNPGEAFVSRESESSPAEASNQEVESEQSEETPSVDMFGNTDESTEEEKSDVELDIF